MPPLRPARQRGAILIMYSVMILILLTMAGLALDLARAFNRKVELQALADAVALAAARELNGTADGVNKAINAAATAASTFHYQYNALPVPWSVAALSFAASATAPDNAWTAAAAAGAAPAGLLYARVDTGELDASVDAVATSFMRVGGAADTVQAGARAVAGRLTIPVTPLAICAQSNTPATKRVNNAANAAYDELVEFGFRRGVSYDLMNLNPNGVTPENFLIDPLSPPGTPGAPANFSTDVVGPFVCAGSMLMPGVTGGTLNVQRNFPLASLYPHLNSRFDVAGNPCTPEAAPPDSNIKSYVYSAIGWMSPATTTQTAASWTSGGTRLWTRADPLPGDATNTNKLYGPLWVSAKAVPYSAYVASPVEPANGYATFSTAAWSTLYAPSAPAASGYPSLPATSTPYTATGSSYALAPTNAPPGLSRRRVLNVALLECPVAAGATAVATVRGVGRFFMTVPATSTSISAEFAGAASQSALAGVVELQR